ncbi:MAG: mechanosensitive ion channel domain-containing protein [Xanthomonadales bacterium]|jgi:small-conductance mechanosensitive channel|nr:mechanosensitive ion channel domain-containing protein [Xanthomonadales bacterium]
MNELEKFWNLPLATLSGGTQITVSQVVLTVVFVVLALAFSWYIQRLVGRQLIKAKVNPTVSETIQRILFYSILVLVFITALGMLKIPVTALAFISGGVAIGVGFGAQNIINNLISSWILMSERPVRIGDFIEIDQHRGVVESIGNRSTRIRRIDGVHLLVPNSQMLERVVINWTLIDKDFRTSVRVGVAYGSNTRLVEDLLAKAADAQKDVLKTPPPIVVFEDYGDSALVFDVFFWCHATGERELRLVRSDIRFRIQEYFQEHGVVIAFPQRDVHLYTHTPVEVTDRPS